MEPVEEVVDAMGCAVSGTNGIEKSVTSYAPSHSPPSAIKAPSDVVELLRLLFCNVCQYAAVSRLRFDVLWRYIWILSWMKIRQKRYFIAKGNDTLGQERRSAISFAQNCNLQSTANIISVPTGRTKRQKYTGRSLDK